MDSFDFYSEKPKLVEKDQKGGMSLTFFSMVLFVLVFFLFTDQINFIIYLVVVLLFHELGHFIAMKTFKYRGVRMMFVPLMGAFVQGTKLNYSQKESFIVTAAGPFPGVIVGGLLICFGADLHFSWMISVGLLFLLLNLINLLPIDPLDGGQMFKLFFREKNELFLMIFAFISSVTIIAVGWYISSYILMIFGFFMGFRVRAMQKRHEIHKELKEHNVDFATTYNLLSNKAYHQIKKIVIEYTPALEKYIDQVTEEELNPILASQVNNVLVTPLNKDAHFLFRFFILVFWAFSFLVPFLLFWYVDIQWYIDGL